MTPKELQKQEGALFNSLRKMHGDDTFKNVLYKDASAGCAVSPTGTACTDARARARFNTLRSDCSLDKHPGREDHHHQLPRLQAPRAP